MIEKDNVKEFRYEDSEESVSNISGPSIFLAGPTVRGHQPHLTSWRFEAIEEFRKQGFSGSLIIPEFTSKVESDKGKEWVPLWEMNGLIKADCILFWIPRTKELIGLTTNWELGFWMGRNIDKVTYGRNDDAYRIGYLDIMWNTEYCGKGGYAAEKSRAIHNTLKETVAQAIRKTTALNPYGI